MSVTKLAGIFVVLLFVCQLASAAAPVHADSPTLRTEHEAMLDLVRDAGATAWAVRSGPWSRADTWKTNSVPGAGAAVLIPKEMVVTIDGPVAAVLRWVRVDGALQWETDRDTSLIVDTLVVTPGGRLEIGTAAHPVAAGVHAKLVFADSGPIDPIRDPLFLGRGLISHGIVRIHGSETTPLAALARAPHRGDDRLTLTQAPKNWKKGDRLILPAVRFEEADEELDILDVRGVEVTVAPLARDHLPPANDLPMYVANLTRNVTIESQNAKEISRRGHVMFMHSGDVDVRYAGFIGLGRTDKLHPISDPELDGAGKLTAGSGANPRGRYAVHFHRTGTASSKPTAIVAGCTVVDCPGWGFVNHSSRVQFDGNISYNVTGAGFVTEAGDEVGSFRNNFAIRSHGSGQDEDERKRSLQDFAHEGDGFWFQGGGVSVEDNIAAVHKSSGFIFFTIGLIENGLGAARFSTANLWQPQFAATISHVDPKDPQHIDDPNSVPVIRVPVRSFARNTAFACGKGFTSRFVQPEPNRSVYEDGVVWNCRIGVHVRYTSNLDLRNLRLVGDPRGKGGYAAVEGTLEGEQDNHYENLRVEGWPVGIAVPEAGHHVISGGYYNNARNIVIPTPLQRGRRVEIIGDIKFASADSARQQYDIDLEARFAPLLDNGGGYRDPNVIFASDISSISTVSFEGRQLYYAEQAADFVPFPAEPAPNTAKRMGRAAGSVPDELIGKTNKYLWDHFGLCVGGALAPADATINPRIHGLVGSAVSYPSELKMSVIRMPQLHEYHPLCYRTDNKQPVSLTAVNLHPGWNLVTQTIDQQTRSFLVFSGESRPVDKKGKY